MIALSTSDTVLMVAGVLTALLLTLPLIYLLRTQALSQDTARFAARLKVAAARIDAFNDTFGRGVSWLTLAMILVQTIVVVQRYVFGVSFIWMQESITYMHGLLFMLAAAFTLLHDGHVRVDIFYREASPRRKALVDFTGCYIFLFPVMFVVFVTATPDVMFSWSTFEGSTETSGIQGVFLLKTVILVFAALLLAQGFSLTAHSALVLTGREQDAPEDQNATPTF